MLEQRVDHVCGYAGCGRRRESAAGRAGLEVTERADDGHAVIWWLCHAHALELLRLEHAWRDRDLIWSTGSS